MSEHLIFIDFGAFSIYWYGVFIGAAVFLAALLFALLGKRTGTAFHEGLTTALWSMPAALVLSRVFYCWFAKASFPGGLWDCLHLLSGGYALYGALLGVLAVLAIRSRLTKRPLTEALDAAVPAVALAIAVGRFAGLTSGGDVGFALSGVKDGSLPFVIWSEAEQSYLLWVGFFEGIAAIVTFVLTLTVFLITYGSSAEMGRLLGQRGSAALTFMALYGFSQTILESMRNDSLYMVTLGFVRISQIVSFVMALTALVVMIVWGCRGRKPHAGDFVMWGLCAAAVGVAVYCEFEMNAVSATRNYIMMGVSLGILTIGFFRSGMVKRKN